MLKKIYNYCKNDALLDIFTYTNKLKTYFFPKRYDLKIEKIVYINNTYILNFCMRDQIQRVKIDIHQVFGNKILIDSISPIDAYICGVIYSLDKHGLIFDNTDYLINYFKSYNHGYSIDGIIDLIDISFYTGEVRIQVGKYARTMKYDELIARPYLLNGLKSYDAARIGAISLDYNISALNYKIGGLCLN